MPINPPPVPPVPVFTANDLVTDALIEIGAIAPGEVPDGDLGQWAFRQLNDLIDTWQAQEAYVYSYNFAVFNTLPSHSPHTIGPFAGADILTANPRPVRIESAAQLQNSSSSTVDLIINIRDKDWWALQQVKDIQTNVITDLYYDPTNPNGSIYFWPVLNAAVQVRLQLWGIVSQFTDITDPIDGPGGAGTLPPAYRAALKYTLAEMLLPGARREAHPTLIEKAKKARMAVFGNNAKSPTMVTADFGMPKAGAGGQRGDFNWFSGGRPGGRPE